jgi:hypothetical protein
MPLILEANYRKKIGLPGYSSHQYSLTLKTELKDLGHAETESVRLHRKLQAAVGRQLQQVGFLPGQTNGQRQPKASARDRDQPDPWACSARQKKLILKLTDEHRLDKVMVDDLAQEKFGHGVKQLDKLEASALIDELLARMAPVKAGDA